MATLQTNIPMMVDVPDIGNALARGMQAGQMAYTNRRGYEADQFKAQNANALMQGDPAALAGLAGYDFDEAQRARIGALNARTAEHRLSAAEAAQTAAELESVMRPLAIAYGKGDQRMFEQALARHPELAGQITWDNFEAIAAETATVYEQLMEVQDASKPDYRFDEKTGRLIMIDPNDPRKSEVIEFGPPQGYRPATPEEAAQYGAAAGQIDTSTGRFYPINPPSGMSIETNADGTMRLTQGPGAGSKSGPSNDEFFSAGTFIDQINSTLDDPALDWSTGALSWTQIAPGTPMRRFKTRADQLSGQAFMNARQALKGGGQITDYEGQRAADAIGRLDTAQSPEDYRNALKEVREILVRAIQRPEGWLNTEAGQVMNMGAGEIAAILKDAREGGQQLSPEIRQAARERLEQLKRWGG